MSNLKILIDTTNIGTTSLDRLSAYDPKESIGAIVELLNAIKGGTVPSTGQVPFQIDENPVKAHGHVTISGEVSVDDVVAVNGVSFTAKSSPTTEFLFQADVDPAVSGASFVSKFNASTSAKLTSITASNVSGTILLEADISGIAGNGFKIVKTTGTNIAVTDFAGGTDGTSTDFNA